MKKNTILSICILFAFFIPWYDFYYTIFWGFELPFALTKLLDLDSSTLPFFYVIYIIPLFSLFNIIIELSKKEIKWKPNEYFYGVLFSIFLIMLELAEGRFNLSFGFYIVFGSSIIGYIITNETLKNLFKRKNITG